MIVSRKAPCSSCGDVALVHALDEGHPLCKDCYTLGSEQADMAHIYAQISLVFFVAPRHLSDMEKAFTRLGRRADRLNLAKPSFKIAGEFFEEYFYGKSLPKSVGVRKLHVVLVNPARSRVKIDGYTFCGTVELGSEDTGGNIIRTVPGETIPKRFRDCTANCEHCNKVRSRKNVYVLRHDTGPCRFVQIGRNCCVDFLGSDALRYADAADYLSTLDESIEACMGSDDDSEESLSSGPRYLQIEAFLSHVAMVMIEKGWISRAMTRERGGESTADTAIKHYYRSFAPREIPLYTKISEEATKLAQAAIAWASAIEGEEVSDFLHNLRVLALRGYLGMRDLGIAAAMIQAYQRDGEYKARGSVPKYESQYLGTVGEKLQTTLRVEKVITIDGSFGTSYLHIFSDAAGNSLKWFSSSARLDEKESYEIRGTIKDQSEYKGRKQTTLTRCSVIENRCFYSPASASLIYAEHEKDAAAKLRNALGVKKLGKNQGIHEFSLMSA